MLLLYNFEKTWYRHLNFDDFLLKLDENYSEEYLLTQTLFESVAVVSN